MSEEPILNKMEQKKVFIIGFVAFISFFLVNCSIFYNITMEGEYQKFKERNGLRVSISFIKPQYDDLQLIFKRNSISKKEQENNKLVFVKIKIENHTKQLKDIYYFNFKMCCEEIASKKLIFIDTDQKGFIVPTEIKFNSLNKLINIENNESVEGYLPFWIPFNTKILALSVSDRKNFPDPGFVFIINEQD
jgi:hypothetical protein